MPLPLLPIAGALGGYGLSYLMPDYRKQFYDMFGAGDTMGSGESMLRALAPDSELFGTQKLQPIPNLTALGNTNPLGAMAGLVPQPAPQQGELSGTGKVASFLLDALTDPLALAAGGGAAIGKRAVQGMFPQAAKAASAGLADVLPGLGEKTLRAGLAGADAAAGTFLPGQRVATDLLSAPWGPTVGKAAGLVSDVNAGLASGVEAGAGMLNKAAAGADRLLHPFDRLGQARTIQGEISRLGDLEGMIQSKLTGPLPPPGPISTPMARYKPEYLAEFPEAMRKGQLALPPDPTIYSRVRPEASELVKQLGLGESLPGGELSVMKTPSFLRGKGGVMGLAPHTGLEKLSPEGLMGEMMGGLPAPPALPASLAESLASEPGAAQSLRGLAPTAKLGAEHVVDLPAQQALQQLALLKEQQLGKLQGVQGDFNALERIMAGAPEPGQSPLTGLLNARRGITAVKGIDPHVDILDAADKLRVTGAPIQEAGAKYFERKIFPLMQQGVTGMSAMPGGENVVFTALGGGPETVRHEVTHGLINAARQGVGGLPLSMRAIAALENSESPIAKALGYIGNETMAHANVGRSALDKLGNAYNFLIDPVPYYPDMVARQSPLVGHAWKYAPHYGAGLGIGGAGLGTYAAVRPRD